ncbi:MAG: recombinase family protein, partial [Ruminococcus sp.]|nr:recombinase family protein [Ruminococcus sp.]
MKAVIYARYSSQNQTEQSIDGQIRECTEFAEKNDYQIIGTYIDRAVSGTSAEHRVQFQQMITDSAKRQFQAVLVYKLDRFARNRYDSAIYKS